MHHHRNDTAETAKVGLASLMRPDEAASDHVRCGMSRYAVAPTQAAAIIAALRARRHCTSEFRTGFPALMAAFEQQNHRADPPGCQAFVMSSAGPLGQRAVCFIMTGSAARSSARPVAVGEMHRPGIGFEVVAGQSEAAARPHPEQHVASRDFAVAGTVTARDAVRGARIGCA
jgi:hypothetical protein